MIEELLRNILLLGMLGCVSLIAWAVVVGDYPDPDVEPEPEDTRFDEDDFSWRGH